MKRPRRPMRLLPLTLFFLFLPLAAPSAAQQSPTAVADPDTGIDTPAPTQGPVCIIRTSMGEIRAQLYADAAPRTVANFLGLAEGTREFIDARSGMPARRPFYDGLVFHRVIPDFMIQGGCPLGTGTGGPGYRFEDEIDADGLGLGRIKVFDPKRGLHPFLGPLSRPDIDRFIFAPIYRRLGIDSQAELDDRREDVDNALAELCLKDVYEAMGYDYGEAGEGSAHRPRRGSLAMANAGPNTNGSQFFINLVDTDWLMGKHTVFGHVIAGMDVVDAIGRIPTGRNDKPLTPVRILSIRRVASDPL